MGRLWRVAVAVAGCSCSCSCSCSWVMEAQFLVRLEVPFHRCFFGARHPGMGANDLCFIHSMVAE